MRAAATMILLGLLASTAAAEVPPVGDWVRYDNKQLGIAVRHPANAKLAVHGGTIAISGPDLPPVTIAVTTNTSKVSGKDGGTHDLQVEWTVTVPKRAAHCAAAAGDPDQANAASSICDSIELTPGARSPHVELIVTTTGLADGAGFERAVRGRQRALDACWAAALRKDDQLPEGSLTLDRTFTDGQAATTDERHENFFDHDTKALAGCVGDALRSVAIKTGDPAAHVKLVAICHLY